MGSALTNLFGRKLTRNAVEFIIVHPIHHARTLHNFCTV